MDATPDTLSIATSEKVTYEGVHAAGSPETSDIGAVLSILIVETRSVSR